MLAMVHVEVVGEAMDDGLSKLFSIINFVKCGDISSESRVVGFSFQSVISQKFSFSSQDFQSRIRVTICQKIEHFQRSSGDTLCQETVRESKKSKISVRIVGSIRVRVQVD